MNIVQHKISIIRLVPKQITVGTILVKTKLKSKVAI